MTGGAGGTAYGCSLTGGGAGAGNIGAGGGGGGLEQAPTSAKTPAMATSRVVWTTRILLAEQHDGQDGTWT